MLRLTRVETRLVRVELNNTAFTTTPTTWLDSRETEGLGETEGRKQILLADLRTSRLAF